jgi:uncharacterized protein (DUF2267 family)
MADLPDPLADADYRALVEALAREGLPRRTEAVRAVEAVACALARLLSDPDDELRELLPEPFRSRLAACERHVGPAASAAGHPFLALVGEDLGVDGERAEPAARAVLAALRFQLSEEAAEDLDRRLPPELLPLWRRPS